MDTLKTSFEDLLSVSLQSVDPAYAVANISGQMHEWFWAPSFWLPEGVTWKDLDPQKNSRFPDPSDITTYPILIGIFFLFLKKLVVVPFILSPLARLSGVRNKKKNHPEPVPDLEILYHNFGLSVPHKMLIQASKRLDWSTKKIEQWLRKKEISQKQTTYEKFMHVGFIAFYQISFTLFGILVLYNKPFIWNAELCFQGFPFHEVSTEIWYYYMIGFGYFWFLSMSLIFERNSKEALIDCIHHTVTILLMGFSWINNFIRIGCLVLALHNLSDSILFPGKMLVYTKHKRMTDAVFAIFVVVWTLTRIIAFPLHVLWNVLSVGFLSKSMFVFEVLLICLFLLHVRWTGLIFKMLFEKIRKGDIVDARSSDEQTDDDEVDTSNKSEMN